MADNRLEQIAQELSASSDYRILRRLEFPAQYCEDQGETHLIGCYLDLETTGLSSEQDKVIEIGIVKFEFTPDGRIYRILDTYGGFEDPKEPLTEKITRLTGITDDMVAGQSIDYDKVREMIKSAVVIIAHNAGFDRKFAEQLLPEFKSKAWGCSLRDIDWESEGIGSAKLDYLAYKYGFFYDGHRAVIDCQAGIHLLTLTLPRSQESVLKSLLDNAREKTYRVWALRSPFDVKDVLKERGYRWSAGENGLPKSWFVDLHHEEISKETAFLHNEIYGQEVELRIDIIDAYSRYSDRG